MKTFIQRFGKNILGVLHGFDRIRFRGTRRFLANVAGMLGYLWQRQVLLKDFKAFAGNITAQVRQAAEEAAVSQGRPIEYLHNSAMKKEDWVKLRYRMPLNTLLQLRVALAFYNPIKDLNSSRLLLLFRIL